MDEVTRISAEAIQRYFTTLSQFGYKKYSDVDKLLVLLFIEEILSQGFLQYITEEDYKVITNALYCLYGSNCMIEFPNLSCRESAIPDSIIPGGNNPGGGGGPNDPNNPNNPDPDYPGGNGYFNPRITEDSILRISEIDFIRIEV